MLKRNFFFFTSIKSFYCFINNVWDEILIMLQWVRSRGSWLPGPLVLPVPAVGLRGSIPGVHESMNLAGNLVRCIGGQPIAATLLVASKMSLWLLWWPPTEYSMCINLQMWSPYSCMLLIVFLLGIKLLLFVYMHLPIYLPGCQLDKRKFVWQPSQQLHNHSSDTFAFDVWFMFVGFAMRVSCVIPRKIN